MEERKSRRRWVSIIINKITILFREDEDGEEGEFEEYDDEDEEQEQKAKKNKK